MLLNFIGTATVSCQGENFVFDSAESRLILEVESTKLVSPVTTYREFSTDKAIVISTRDIGKVIEFEGVRWETSALFLGGNTDYAVFVEQAEQDTEYYVGRDWAGSSLFSLPYIFHDETFFGRDLFVMGDEKQWSIYDLQGHTINTFAGGGESDRSGYSFFTESYYFFRTRDAYVYQVYETATRSFCRNISFETPLLGVLQLPDGCLLALDCLGIRRISRVGEALCSEVLYSFSTPIDCHFADALLWHDSGRVYIGLNTYVGLYSGGNHQLIALSLSDNSVIETVRWVDDWEITNRCGFVGGKNYLTLQRKYLLSDGAILLWGADEPLTSLILQPDVSPHCLVSQSASSKKGKHGYRIEVQDASVNRAIRTAALHIGRLLSESCKGAYNHNSREILDRKFDGQFSIEIRSTTAPNEFEQAYLPDLIEYFRYWGGLSPAGSNGSLLVPEVTWLPISTD
jgi:hypothetical protein